MMKGFKSTSTNPYTYTQSGVWKKGQYTFQAVVLSDSGYAFAFQRSDTTWQTVDLSWQVKDGSYSKIQWTFTLEVDAVAFRLIANTVTGETIVLQPMLEKGTNGSTPIAHEEDLRGMDGDNHEFIFTRNTTGIAPDTPLSTQEDDYEPEDWTDNAQGVTPEIPYEFVSMREKKNGVWLDFSPPSLWAKWGEDGLSVNLLVEGHYNSHWEGTTKVVEIVGGVDVGGSEVVKVSAVFRKGEENIAATVSHSRGFQWYVNGVHLTAFDNQPFITLDETYGDGFADYVVLSYLVNSIREEERREIINISEGMDGIGEEFIFKANNSDTEPPVLPQTTDVGYQNDDYHGNWSDDPVAPTKMNQFVWVAKRKKVGGIWEAFGTPSVWTKWVTDGDGAIEKFKSSATQPSTPTGEAEDWDDNPTVAQQSVLVPTGNNLYDRNYLIARGWVDDSFQVYKIGAGSMEVVVPSTKFKANKQYRVQGSFNGGGTGSILTINYSSGLPWEKMSQYEYDLNEITDKNRTVQSITISYGNASISNNFTVFELVESGTKNLPIWVTRKTIKNEVESAWSTPVKWTGEDGEKGKDGTGINVVGSANTWNNLPTSGNNLNDARIVQDTGVLAVWDGTKWVEAGEIKGPAGDTPYIGGNGNWWIGGTDTGIKAKGDKGDKGDGVRIVGSFNDPSELSEVSNPTLGDGYMINGDLWVYVGGSIHTPPAPVGWNNVGRIKGDDGHSPYIDETTNTWWTWNEELGIYTDTGYSPVGSDGAIPYPAGYYDNTKWYRREAEYAPYVQYGGTLYLLIKDTPNAGIATSNTTYWKAFNHWEAVFVDSLVAAFAKIGGVVFTGNTDPSSPIRGRLISERGVDGTANFQNYTGDGGSWQPNIMLNFTDGSGQLAGGNISWDEEGAVELAGVSTGAESRVKLSQGMIKIESDFLLTPEPVDTLKAHSTLFFKTEGGMLMYNGIKLKLLLPNETEINQVEVNELYVDSNGFVKMKK